MSDAVKTAYDLISQFEGLRLIAYPDPHHGWDLPTIGYGTTVYPDGKRVGRTDKITNQKAAECLQHFVAHNIVPVMSKIPNWEKLNTNQQAAVICFAYNLGSHFYGSPGFKSITTLLDTPSYWTDDNYVHRQFEKYCNPDDPKITKGLKRRRRAEADLFCKDV